MSAKRKASGTKNQKNCSPLRKKQKPNEASPPPPRNNNHNTNIELQTKIIEMDMREFTNEDLLEDDKQHDKAMTDPKLCDSIGAIRRIFSTIFKGCLLEEDKQYDKAMAEAKLCDSAGAMRRMFAIMLKDCNINEPEQLWGKYKYDMIEDIINKHKRAHTIDQSVQLCDNLLKKMYCSALYEICTILEQYNVKKVKYDGLVKPKKEDCYTLQTKEILAKRSYNKMECREEYMDKFKQMNSEQQRMFIQLITAIYPEDDINQFAADMNVELDELLDYSNEDKNIFFIDGPSGVGKTFVCIAILAYVRSKDGVALPCTSSVISATNFKGGQTVDSRFRVPLKICATSTCFLTKLMGKFQLIREASVIIWDEAPMQQRWIMECVDRTLRTLLDNNKPFGGKVIIFSGDYRQVSCFIPRASQTQIVESIFTNSRLWKHIKTLYLTENERIKRCKYKSDADKLKIEKFANFLLEIGEGRHPYYKYKFIDDLIKIPKHLLSKSKTISELIDEVYGNLQNIDDEDIDYSLLENAILTPKNENVRKINTMAIAKFPGILTQYKSINTICDDSHQCQYTNEYLDSLEINGLPEHLLNLKIGAPVIVVRNIDPLNGVYNGTRGLVTKLGTSIVKIKIMDTNKQYKEVILYRIPLKPSDPNVPIAFKRSQFPIHLSFAMIINKAQGQTLNKVRIFLPDPVVSHGELYVAFNRVTHPDNVKIFIADNESQGRLNLDKDDIFTRNIVFPRILKSAGIIDVDIRSNVIKID